MFADKIRDDVLKVYPPAPVEYDLAVLAVGDGIVTIALPKSPQPDLVSDEIMGLRWEGGYGQTSAVTSRDATSIDLEFQHLHGTRLAAGDEAALDSFAYPPDPCEGRGIGYSLVTYKSEFGEFPAWYVAGSRSTWAIFTHGRGAHPAEALRVLPAFVAAGYPCLLIFYRNDPDSPATSDRLARFGAHEWKDLDGAVGHALARGANDVVLVGFSMGGAVSVSFAYRSGQASRIRGMVLDSPALDLEAMVDAGAQETRLPLIGIRVPRFVTALVKKVASIRFDIDWDGLDYVDRAAELTAPILLIHGDADDAVPVSIGDRLAAARPDLVQYERVPDAGHVRSWNVDRERYEQAVTNFLASLDQ